MFNFFKKIHKLLTFYLCNYEMNKDNHTIEQEIIQDLDNNFKKYNFKNKDKI